MPKCQSCGTGVAQEFQHYKSGVWQCAHVPDVPDWQQTVLNMIGTENATGSVMHKLGQIERLVTRGPNPIYSEVAFLDLKRAIERVDKKVSEPEAFYKGLYEDYKDLHQQSSTSRDWWKMRCEILEEKLEEEREMHRHRHRWWQRRKV